MAYIKNRYTAFDPHITISTTDNASGVVSGIFSNPQNVVINATSVKEYRLSYTNAIKISLPNCTSVGRNAFRGTSTSKPNPLEELYLPNCETFGALWGNYCSLNKLDISSCKHGNDFPDLRKSSSERYEWQELKCFIKYPFEIDADEGELSGQSNCQKLIMRINTQHANYQEALEYILSCDFSEFYLYNEEGEPITI